MIGRYPRLNVDLTNVPTRLVYWFNRLDSVPMVILALSAIKTGSRYRLYRNIADIIRACDAGPKYNAGTILASRGMIFLGIYELANALVTGFFFNQPLSWC